ncbi:MAG TPA: DUF983 domain-containing protein [Limnochordales bacterium]
MGGLARAFWTGWRLRCPACSDGSLEAGGQLHPACPRCGWQLTKPGEGDWLVTWLVAYTVGSVALLLSLLALYLFSGFGIGTQLIISSVVGVVATAVTFRRARGAAVGILYFLRRHWEE